MRKSVLEFLREHKETVLGNIEACELMIFECRADPENCAAVSAVQAKYEAVADEFDTQIQKLR